MKYSMPSIPTMPNVPTLGNYPVAYGSITAANALLDTTATNAFAAPVGVDLSAYQDGRHILWLQDTSGYVAFGHISGTAPGGETLDSELIAAGWSNVAFETLTNNANNRDIDSAINDSNVAVAIAKNGAPMGEANKLYKWAYGRTVNSGQTPGLAITTAYNGTATDLPATAAAAAGNYYVTFGGARYLSIYVTAASNFSSTNSLKNVTDCAATGALIVSTQGGATRAWTSKHASFNPNAELTYKVLFIGD